MKELIAKNFKQLVICLKFLHAEKIEYLAINIIEDVSNKKIIYQIVVDTDDDTYEVVKEKYRILIS